MKLRITPDGTLHAIAPDSLEFFNRLGNVQVQRVSRVEPVSTESGMKWSADLALVGGPVLGPFQKRSEAIQAELEWLDKNLF